MGGMKRLVLTIVALGVAVSCALVAGPVQAYQPVEDEILFADPETSAPGAPFDAVIEHCFPGEQVVFFNFGTDPDQSAVDICDETTYTARVTFQAPDDIGDYEIGAFLAAETSDNPDIPDRPYRFLRAMYFVEDVTFPIDTEGSPDGDSTAISTVGSGDIWPSFLSSAGFYRTFLGLLALLAGIFFVFLWRRRREDERIEGTGPAGTMPPPDPATPSIA